MSSIRGDCRKFVPNIFNKTKCSNCFRQKEEHSAEALESNRASRNISKCGYLFVAPGWDFSNPLNRTKRWQRRWFVLYDDGELSYALDEHPETIPQASIDMNKVLEVSDAEEVTGNAYSIAITLPDSVHFVKGTCREESKWWKDVLNVFPRSKGRHKRNATFSGCQTTQSPINTQETRPRFNSCNNDTSVLIRAPSSSSWLHVEEEEIFPTRDIETNPDNIDSQPPYTIDSKENRSSYLDTQPISSSSPPTRDKIHSEDKARTRRTLNREKRGLKTGRSFTEDITILRDSNIDNVDKPNEDISQTDEHDITRRILFESEKTKREEKLKDIADSLTRPRLRRHTQTIMNSYERRSTNHIKPTRDGENEDDKRSVSPVVRGVVDGSLEKPVRGDPDGCGLDLTSQRYSPSSELRVDLPAEDLLNIKKGWLMKQNVSQEWTKHWFVLRGAALMYYRDPTAEDKGILDGVIDLTSINGVSELQVARNYGFQAVSWDDRRYVLSAVTAGIRNNWMAAIRRAVGIPEPIEPIELTLGEKLEREIEQHTKALQRSAHLQYYENKISSSRFPSSTSSPSSYLPPSGIQRSPSSHYVDSLLQKSVIENGIKRSSSSSYLDNTSTSQRMLDEYRSSGERRESESDWREPPAPLPPSPPLNRTPISRVKERAKTQTSRSKVYSKRSKSSPPSSRRNTLEGIRTEEASDKSDDRISSRLSSVERHLKEVEDLKSQLNMALNERSSVEKELVRLRQRKSEASLQMEDLIKTLKMTEDELKIRTKELEEFDILKQRYNQLVKEHDEVLASWRESSVSEEWRHMYDQLHDQYSSDENTWKLKLDKANTLLQDTTTRCELLTRQLEKSEETVTALRNELSNLSERLIRGMEENEGLYGRLQDLEGRCLSSSRERGRSVDSLSDLTNIDLDIDLQSLDKDRIIEEYEELKGRFEKAVQEIRAMKRELRESHASYDDLELAVITLRQDSKRKEESYQAEASLMACRIEDLTLKLSAAEKQVRTLKQKMSKCESREKRRSLSLKGRESFQIGKELEEKLSELENKINTLETGKPIFNKSAPTSPEKDKTKKDGRLRRKSLESATSSEPMKVVIRLSSLERKVSEVNEKLSKESQDDTDSLPTYETLLKSKIQDCKHLVTNIKSSRRPSSPSSSRSSNLLSLEKRLAEVEELLEDYKPSQLPRPDIEVNVTSIRNVITKLEGLLKTKITDLVVKRNDLRDKNQLTDEAKLKLLAEKLAYESIVVKRIQQIVQQDENVFLDYELCEANHYIDLLKRKLKGQNVVFENSLNSLTKSIANMLYSQGVLVSNDKNKTQHLKPKQTSNIEHLTLEIVQQNQRELNRLVNSYKEEKLQELAKSLAIETLCLTAEYEEEKEKEQNSLEDRRIREAWTLAQEALNRELVQAELSHVTMRCAGVYEAFTAQEFEANLTFASIQNANMEEYTKVVEFSLHQVMERFIDELTEEYERYLTMLKNDKCFKNNSQLEENSKQCRSIMENFVDILAQKALIDCRIEVLNKEIIKEEVAFNTKPVVKNVLLKTIPVDVGEPSLEAEFQYLFQKYSVECLQTVGQMLSEDGNNVKDVMEALNEVECELDRLRSVLNVTSPVNRKEMGDNSWCMACKKCQLLRTQISEIVKCVEVERPCQRCEALEITIVRREEEHEEDMDILRRNHDKEVKALRGELEHERHSLVCQHEQEQAQLKEKARKLERRLETLDAEYSQQMDNLRTAYHKTLSTEMERDENTEDSIRQRYQSEIEQLRALCEKGLLAVDNSHRRIIAELEEKHRQELAHAAAEKEQALAEETQATLAALDAMRKAHETEVQKEINKFKAEFLKKMQSSSDLSALHKEHEKEMEEIKKEILSLSEKYSTKCVESAALEEQLGVVNKQLNQAQQHIMQLDSRNKQLRAHLLSETEDSARLKLEDEANDDAYKSFGDKYKRTHSLDEYKRTCITPTREPVSLDRYLNNSSYRQNYWTTKQGSKIYLAENPGDEDGEKKRIMEPTALPRAELVRSPKYSLVNLHSAFNSPTLGGQLSGMVAERKKLFEH